MRRAKFDGGRYHVVIVDEQDLNAVEPESALIEKDDLELCKNILAEYLSDTAGIVRAFIEDSTTGKHVYTWIRN
jgi:hypothetical protein